VLFLLVAGASAPTAHAQGATPLRATHALPVSYYPEPNAVLRVSPPDVRITFSELLNPDISKIVVVNPSNQEVDNRDSQISADGYTMTVTLPLLTAGTYVVFWRTHSATDGHIVGGSYLFHITRADGTVPSFTGPLPRGTFAGGAGSATGALDGPTLTGGLARWVALLMITLLLGMIFWVLVVQPRQRTLPATIVAGSQRHMRRAAWIALWVLLGATLVEVGAQAWLLDGSWRGLTSPTLLESILLTSRYGEAILLRLIVVVIGLVTLWLSAPRRAGRAWESLFDPRVALGAFGVFLALTYEFSGHGGSTTLWWEPVVDFLHLIANGIWLGGLLTLALTLVPALRAVAPEERRAYVAASIPAFSIPALVAVALLVVTGPLNATARLLNVSQLWTTPYGMVLDIKSALFLVMVAISYYHAFVLRPLLDGALSHTGAGVTKDTPQTHVAPPDTPDGVPIGWIGWLRRWVSPAHQRIQAMTMRALLGAEPALAPLAAGVPHPDVVAADLEEASLPITVTQRPEGAGKNQESARALAKVRGGSIGDGPGTRIERAILHAWRIEALVGAGVLLCAALMGPLAGTLEALPATTTASFGAAGGAQAITQRVDGLSVTMSVDPGKFGTNTFTVTIKQPDGQPAQGASVFIVSSMVEMDMGENTINLTPTATPGVYGGQGELSMAGHWRLRTVIRAKEDPAHLHTTTFTISASF
jgi:putative copper export protein/methionine-rich copper-binding protein CopC